MSAINKNDFIRVVTNIKQEIQTTQVKTLQQVNSNLIMMYFRIGKILSEFGSNDPHFINKVELELKIDFPTLQGFSGTNLRRMRSFYEEYKNDQKCAQLVLKLSWGHNILLLSKIKDRKIRELYMRATIENGWSRNVLAMQIESGYHQRIGKGTNNFKSSLSPTNSDLVNKMMKDPYIFDFLTLKEGYKEKELERAMTERIKNVLMELGKGFSFVGNQYKIGMPDGDYYIDLLFYHLDLRCYIAIELKATKFKPEYIGQLGFYVTAIDETLKKANDNQTIGLLLCREKDKLTVNWSLRSSKVPIGVSEFELEKYIPKDVLEKLPTKEDLDLYV